MSFSREESFFDLQPMFICEQATLKILDVNAATTAVLGFEKKNLLNKELNKFGERRSMQDLKAHLSYKDNSQVDEIWSFKTQKGGYAYFQLSAHLINYKGKPAKLIVAHDFTETLEKKTKKRKKRPLSSQLQIQNYPLAEIEWDANLNIISWSPKAERLFGYSEEAAMSESNLLNKFVHKEDIEFVKGRLEQTYKQRKKDISVINRNITRNGEVIYCKWNNSFLYDKNGEVAAIYSLVQDVTEHQRALNDAKRSMKSYQDLFNSISDAIFLLDEHGIIAEANDGLEKTFGYKRKEVIGKPYKVLAAPGKYDEEFLGELFARVFDGEPSDFEGWGRKKNGEVFPAEYLLNTSNYFGKKKMIVIARDISDRKQSEEALKEREGLFTKLFNSSPIGITLLNKHHEVDMVNDGFEQLFGYREHELKGLKLDQFIVPKMRHKEAQELSESANVQEVTEKRVRKDGTILDVIIYAVPVVVEKNVVGIYGIYIDITTQKNTEEQLHKSLKEKEMLLAEVHHRVKNNLAVITGLLELQSYSAGSESAKRILKDSQMRINSIAMVHEKLYQSEDFAEVNIEQYFKELTEVIHKTMNRKETKVHIELDIMSAELPITQAIPCGLLLNEILTNSFKHAFTGRKQGEVRVSFKKSNGHILFTIRDNGIGMPEDLARNLSESLGFTLIKTLASQLEAKFDFYNDEGAVFKFKFKKNKAKAL